MLMTAYLIGAAAVAGLVILAAIDSWRGWDWRVWAGVVASVVLWFLLPVFALLSVFCIIALRVDNKGAMYEPRIRP